MAQLEVPRRGRGKAHSFSRVGGSSMSGSPSESQSPHRERERQRDTETSIPHVSATSTPTKSVPQGYNSEHQGHVHRHGTNGGGSLSISNSALTDDSEYSQAKPLSRSTSFQLHNNGPDHSEHSASHFISSIVSAAKDAATSWGMKTGEEDGHYGDFGDDRNSSLSPNHEEQGPNSASVGKQGTDTSSRGTGGVAAVPINPLKATISTLGKGQLSLDSLDELNTESNYNGNAGNFSGISNIGNGNGSFSISRESSLKSPNSSEFNLPHFHHLGSGAAGKSQTSGSLTSASPAVATAATTAGGTAASKGPSRSVSISRPDATPRSSVLEHLDSDASDEDRERSPESKVHKKRIRSSRRGGRATESRHVTGFAFADRKRNREFHRIFRSISADDYLLDDFSCALSREILLQGRLYVSEKHICFNANILGWVTNLVIAFDEMVSLEKKNTAGLFPNGIVVQTLHARHSFASFVSRDSTIDFIHNIWKQSGISKKDGSETQSDVSDNSDVSSATGYSDSDVSKADNGSTMNSFSDDGISDSDLSKELASSDDSVSLGTSDEDFESSAKAKAATDEKKNKSEADPAGGSSAGGKSDDTKGGWPLNNLGPETHAPCPAPSPPSPEKVIYTGVIRAPPGVVANLIYGESTEWYFNFLTNIEKNYDITSMPKFQEKSRNYEYTKPLNSSVGPKSTKCICKETIEKWDFESDEGVVIGTATQTPGVPSGNSFVTKSRTYLTWTNNNQTKLTGSFWMEWSGKSWLKGPIERGAEDGQVQSCKDIVEEANKYLTTHNSGVAKAEKKPKTKKPKRSRKSPKVEGREKLAAPAADGATLTSKSLYPIYLLAFLALVFLCIAIIRPLFSQDHDAERLKLVKLEQEYDMWKWIDDRSGVTANLDVLEPLNSDEIHNKHSKQELEELIRITQMRIDLLKQRISSN